MNNFFMVSARELLLRSRPSLFILPRSKRIFHWPAAAACPARFQSAICCAFSTAFGVSRHREPPDTSRSAGRDAPRVPPCAQSITFPRPKPTGLAMVALTLVANAARAVPTRHSAKSAKAHAVGATPAFVARHRGDAGVAVSARSRKASHRLVIARAGGEVRVHSLPLTDGSVRRLSAYPVCLSAATGFRSSAR